MVTKSENKKTSRVSFVIFAATFVIVAINFVSLVFPALITNLTNEEATRVDPFELGVSAIPVLIINFILLGLAIAYYKKILPNAFLNSIKFLLKFEVSQRIAAITIVVILAVYIVFTVEELTIYEGEQFGDFKRIR